MRLKVLLRLLLKLQKVAIKVAVEVAANEDAVKDAVNVSCKLPFSLVRVTLAIILFHIDNFSCFPSWGSCVGVIVSS